MDQTAYDQAAAGLHEMVKKQPGFIMHVAYPTPEGFSVGEVWESQEQQESWFNEHVAPNVPPALLGEMSGEYIKLHAVVQP
jgi:heme-degrading monooxygenase HmoA